MPRLTEAEKAEKQARDDATREWHNEAVASGQKRILSRTSKETNYELHSYLPDEIGFSRRYSGVVVSSTWGMFALGGFLALGCLLSLILFIAPVFSGEQPTWGVLFTILISGLSAPFAFKCGMQDVKAKRIRRERGVPDPSPNQTDH